MRCYELMFFALPLIAMQAWQYRSNDLLVATKLHTIPRGLLYGVLFAAIVVFGAREPVEFIYFQF